MLLSKNRCLCLIVFCLLFLPSNSVCQSNDINEIFTAMNDELERSMTMLQIEDLEKPYYIGYTIEDRELTSISASFGALINSNQRKARTIAVDIRVGDYVFDNTNFSSRFAFGSGRLSTTQSILDNDYSILRHDLWRITDLAYKDALEKISNKRAAVQTQKIEEEIDDFEKIDPITSIEDQAVIKVDKIEWENRLKRLSEIFKDFLHLDETSVDLRIELSNTCFLNSEERKLYFNNFIISLGVFIAAQTENGTKITNSKEFHALSLEDFPSETELVAQIRALAEETELLRTTPVLDDYDGPILLTGEAAAEFFRQLLSSNLSGNRTPIVEDVRFQNTASRSKLARKINRRIAADFITAVDDPTMTHFNGSPMIGAYSMDDEGVRPAPLPIIEEGIMKNYYMSRIPTIHLNHTNGHGRSSFGSISVGRIGNLIISAKDGLSPEILEKEFIQLCKDEGLKFGIKVTRLMEPSAGSRAARMGFSSSYVRRSEEVSNPITAYKVYVDDGHEEPVRGFEIADVKVRLMKDILFAGNDAAVYNYIDSGPSGNVPATIVSPSIILEEVELRKVQQILEKAPLLTNPYIKK